MKNELSKIKAEQRKEYYKKQKEFWDKYLNIFKELTSLINRNKWDKINPDKYLNPVEFILLAWMRAPKRYHSIFKPLVKKYYKVLCKIKHNPSYALALKKCRSEDKFNIRRKNPNSPLNGFNFDWIDKE